MIVFGLTGNTGTGKTTVAQALGALGVPVVDADQIARDLVRPGEPALDEIVSAFGPDVLDETGALRRQELGRRIFGDPAARVRLEAITHPRIARRSQQMLLALQQSGASLAVYDSAILVETGMARAFAGLIVVSAERPQQVARIMARDGLSRADAEQRVDAQLPLSEKVRLADYVIDNSGSPEALAAQIEALRGWMETRSRPQAS